MYSSFENLTGKFLTFNFRTTSVSTFPDSDPIASTLPLSLRIRATTLTIFLRLKFLVLTSTSSKIVCSSTLTWISVFSLPSQMTWLQLMHNFWTSVTGQWDLLTTNQSGLACTTEPSPSLSGPAPLVRMSATKLSLLQMCLQFVSSVLAS